MVAVMGRKPKGRKSGERPGHPLLQWRETHERLQKDVAGACGMSQATLSKIENWQRVPLGDWLERLMDYTGLPADAFVRAERFLQEHPNFLSESGLRHRPSPHPGESDPLMP